MEKHSSCRAAIPAAPAITPFIWGKENTEKTVTTSKITGLQKKVTLKKGKKLTLKPSRTPITSTKKFTYKSSNKKIATVSSKGVIKGKKTGKAKITVKSGKKKYTVTVIVTK